MSSEICPTTASEEYWISFRIIMASSSLISIVGSSTIICMILRGPKKLRQLNNRIILSMSFVDILYSGALLFSTTPIPRNTHCTFGNIGNAQTCAAQGFFIHIGTCVPLYNAMLCLYYVARICYKIDEATIKKHCEIYMHIIALILPLGVAILGVAFNLFHSRLVFCWFANECRFGDEGCGEGWNGTRAKVFNFVLCLSFGSFILVTLTIIASMSMIFFELQKRERASKRYLFSAAVASSNSLNTRCSKRTSVAQIASEHTIKQAILYVCALLVTYSPSMVSFIYDVVCRNRTCETPIDELNILIAIFHPLQGFFNFIIYIRPRYNLVKSQNREMHFWSVLKVVILELDCNQKRRRSVPRVVNLKQARSIGSDIMSLR